MDWKIACLLGALILLFVVPCSRSDRSMSIFDFSCDVLLRFRRQVRYEDFLPGPRRCRKTRASPCSLALLDHSSYGSLLELSFCSLLLAPSERSSSRCSMLPWGPLVIGREARSFLLHGASTSG